MLGRPAPGRGGAARGAAAGAAPCEIQRHATLRTHRRPNGHETPHIHPQAPSTTAGRNKDNAEDYRY
ncbi:hypothetical protein PUR61_00175, partial [Streptomyces sp. BE20]|uniref:hypothetical protein n=1 Tax=Streptomyces sp. BE20 TaxID=3002525 RepID=UPI002E79B052